MRHEKPVRADKQDPKEQTAMARYRAEHARTTQERLHYEGMAEYWEELLNEKDSEALGSALRPVERGRAG
jgi:hypothetical protein